MIDEFDSQHSVKSVIIDLDLSSDTFQILCSRLK